MISRHIRSARSGKRIKSGYAKTMKYPKNYLTGRTERVTMAELRADLGRFAELCHENNYEIVATRFGQPILAIISVAALQDYHYLCQQREADAPRQQAWLEQQYAIADEIDAQRRGRGELPATTPLARRPDTGEQK